MSSAIHTRYGVYDTETRLNQTIDTCKSIRERCDADIVILDGGERSITVEERAIISPHINRFYDFTAEETVKSIQSINNHDVVKNMIEIVMFGSFFELMSMNSLDLDHYDRIFKMSGRYTLNDDFDYDMHMNATDRIVIRGPYTSQFTPEITGGVTRQYMSRLWSFDSNLTSYISKVYANMFDNMQKRLNEGGYIDIEHLLYAHLNSNFDLVVNPQKIGVEGNIAPNGAGVSE